MNQKRDLSAHRVIWAPRILMTEIHGSNGMAAGNTLEEAMVPGNAADGMQAHKHHEGNGRHQLERRVIVKRQVRKHGVSNVQKHGNNG